LKIHFVSTKWVISVSPLATQFLKIWGFFPKIFKNCVAKGEVWGYPQVTLIFIFK
jgi:hypothetical protein